MDAFLTLEKHMVFPLSRWSTMGPHTQTDPFGPNLISLQNDGLLWLIQMIM